MPKVSCGTTEGQLAARLNLFAQANSKRQVVGAAKPTFPE